jgi:hypothetical protein
MGDIAAEDMALKEARRSFRTVWVYNPGCSKEIVPPRFRRAL